MIKRITSAIMLLSLCFLATPSLALAYSPYSGVNCSAQASSSTVCKDRSANNDPLIGSDGLLIKITNLVAFIGGAAAIIVILIGAIRFVTSGSDISTGSRTDADVENARHSIANALVGLAVIILARTLIVFVVRKI